MGLSEDEKDAIVKYRLERANDTLFDVEFAVSNMRWNNAANRLYYACYYAAIALLLNDGYITRTHNGVKALLGLHYEKEKIIDDALMKAYRKMFNLRQTGDYDDLAVLTKDEILVLIEPAKRFIKAIELLINNKKPIIQTPDSSYP